MSFPSRQRGLGMWGWFIVLGLVGFFSLVAMKVAPMYLNYMAVNKAVRTVALDPGNGSLPVTELRRALQRFWEIEDIKIIKPQDVKVTKFGAGRAMSFDYEDRAEIFEDIYIVIHFKNQYPMKGGGSIE
jgi:hypothetical protein